MTADPIEEWDTSARHVGRRVRLFAELPSTNDFATGCQPGEVVIARHQTQGRGQYGRVWRSRPGASLLLSAVVAPPIPVRRPVVLTAWAAVAVADTVERLAGVRVRQKWPNDLLVGDKKVCGILIEQAANVVVGLGLNLTQTAAEFAAAGLPDATSLGMLSGRDVGVREAAEAVVAALDAWYAPLADGDLAGLESAWTRRLGLSGRAVAIDLSDGGEVVGRVRHLAFDAVEVDCGQVVPVAVPPERIRHVRVLDS